jgi:membrane protein implicated in regulation of membrane protease activity
MMGGYQPDFWHWWILGVALIIVETLVPGTFFLWMGVAALVVGFVAWLAPVIGWEYQLMLFAVLSLVAIAGWRAYQRRHPEQTDHPSLNRRGEQYVGEVFVLETPIENGFGKVRVGDSLWRVRGDDAPAGCRVRVTGTEGVLLLVEPAD